VATVPPKNDLPDLDRVKSYILLLQFYKSFIATTSAIYRFQLAFAQRQAGPDSKPAGGSRWEMRSLRDQLGRAAGVTRAEEHGVMVTPKSRSGSDFLSKMENNLMKQQVVFASILAAILFLVSSIAAPSIGFAQTEKVKTAMASLIAKAGKLGPPKIEGTDSVGDKSVPDLYFGTTKMNKFFDVVDEVVKENGGTATLFVKAGAEYVRVATNVKKDDGSRAIGTILDPNGPAIAMIKKGEAYYGDATILGKPYITGYDPIKDTTGTVIGIYYVGYLKE
jgi:hypothetical protein